MKKAKKITMTILCVLIIIMCVNNLTVARISFDPINIATDIFGLVASVFAIISIYNKKFTDHPAFKIVLLLLIIAVAIITGLSGYLKSNPIMMILAILFLAIGFRLIVIMKTQRKNNN